MNDKLDLSLDINQIIKSVSLKKSVLALAVSLGVFGTMTPFLFKQLDRESKTLLLLSGLIGNLTASLLPRDTKDEKLKTFYEKQVTDNYANQLRHEVIRSNAVTEIREKNLLAEFIDNDAKVPWFQKQFWANKFGVVPLITSFFVASSDEPPEEDNNQPLTAKLPLETLANKLKVVAQENAVNLDWVTEIVAQSKMLVGGRGSGKSRFMRYLLALYILSFPTDEWYVIDPHYEGYSDDEEFDCNNPDMAWLLGVNPELLKSKIIDNIKDGYTLLMTAYATLKDRIAKKLKYPKVPKIMVFIDEFEAFKKGLSDEEFTNLLEFIEVVQDEGRKFGVELSIGCHSLKKERTGVDSTVISQMYWLLFENAASDRATVFPADFDQKDIVKKLKKVNQRKDPKKQRSYVLTTPRGEVSIDLLPLLELPTFSLDEGTTTPVEVTPVDTLVNTPEFTDEQKVFIVIQNWVCDRTEKPTASEVWQMWERLSGKKLNENGLKYLMEKLGL